MDESGNHLTNKPTPVSLCEGERGAVPTAAAGSLPRARGKAGKGASRRSDDRLLQRSSSSTCPSQGAAGDQEADRPGEVRLPERSRAAYSRCSSFARVTASTR